MGSGSEMKNKIAYVFGAGFVEVRINKWTHGIRLPRTVGAFARARCERGRNETGQRVFGTGHQRSCAMTQGARAPISLAPRAGRASPDEPPSRSSPRGHQGPGRQIECRAGDVAWRSAIFGTPLLEKC